MPLAAWAAVATEPAKPNILWITAENMGPDLGCYPDSPSSRLVHTPHLDRLAREGLRYRLAFDTSPGCSPSRSAFMTGMYQTTIGAHGHRSHRDDHFQLPAGVQPLTHRLMAAGYFTGNIMTMNGHRVGTGKTDLNFEVIGPVLNTGLARQLEDPVAGGLKLTDRHNDQNSIRLYQTSEWPDLKTRQPFFAQINLPTVERTKRGNAYGWTGSKAMPAFGTQVHPARTDPDSVIVPPYYPEHPITRRDWANYLDAVGGTDLRVGEILAQLEADGLADNTIVIFFADNGRIEARGHHWCYDSGQRVPLIIRWPKNFAAPAEYRAGTMSERMVSLLDLTATTLSFAGVAKPDGMQSEIFLGPGSAPPRRYTFGARDRAGDVPQRIRTVRSTRYRYIRNFMPEFPFSYLSRYKEASYPVMALMRRYQAEGKLTSVQAALMAPRQPDEELYDLGTDPYEIYNLASSPNPEHQRLRQELRAELDRWIEDTNDQGRFPESPETIRQATIQEEARFGVPDWAADQRVIATPSGQRTP